MLPPTPHPTQYAPQTRHGALIAPQLARLNRAETGPKGQTRRGAYVSQLHSQQCFTPLHPYLDTQEVVGSSPISPIVTD